MSKKSISSLDYALLFIFGTSLLQQKLLNSPRQLYLRAMESDSQLYPISLHPKAYRFFPKRQQEKSSFDKKGTRYYFFGQIEHDEYEQRKLKQFHEYVLSKGKTYNKGVFPNDQAVLLVLATTGYKPKQALKAMQEYTQFIQVTVPSIKRQRVEALLKTGFYYVCGTDKLFRPIIVFRVKLIDENAMDLATEAVIYTLEEVRNKMHIPGQVENWNVIYDLGGIKNMMDLPVSAIKKIVTNLQMVYAFKLWRSFVLNAPNGMTMFWKLVSAFLDDSTVEKTKITSENTDKALFQNICPTQIEQKYGGTQKNRVEFFPFKTPAAVYAEHRLISDEEYEKRLKEGKLSRNKIDPLFMQKKK